MLDGDLVFVWKHKCPEVGRKGACGQEPFQPRLLLALAKYLFSVLEIWVNLVNKAVF